MQWADSGLVIGVRRHGETSAVLDLLTREHGRHLGLVHGGRSRRMQPVLQPGNTVQAVWRARLDEQLGTYSVEAETLRSPRLIGSRLALYGLATLSALLRALPERDPHPALFAEAEALVDHLDDPALAPEASVRFELLLLAELGFGLDLTSCAATEATTDLAWVSPRSARAVSRGAGEPYRDRLLALPPFLVGEGRSNRPSRAELADAFALTGHFLAAHALGPRDLHLPEERARFVGLCLETADAS